MKKTTTIIMMALTAVILVLSGCNKNKKKNENPMMHDVAEKVVGNYEGYMLAESNFFSDMFSADESIVITKKSKTTVDVVCESKVWGVFTIENAGVTGSTAPYTISGSGTCKMGMGGQMKDYDCVVSAMIYGTDADMISFEIPSVMGGTKIVFHRGAAPLGYYVRGEYDGTLSYSVAGSQYPSTDAKVILKKDYGNTISITLPAVDGGMMSLPEVALSGVVISTTDNVNFKIEKTEINATVGTTNYAGTLSGNIKGSALTLEYSIKPGAMPINIDFVFTGEK